MSKELPQSNTNEEVDLLILFNYIGERINKFFGLFKKLFLFLYSIFIYAAKAVFQHIKLIAIAMVLAGISGYILESNKPKVYDSSMLVRTYFDAKYQLATNIKYYNALLGDKNYETLSNIFEVSVEEIAEIELFEMYKGPETENERIIQYDQFLKSIDSIRAQDISFDDFIENRDIYSGNLFEIRVESRKKDIFKSLEVGINKSFENVYSSQEMAKRDSTIALRKQIIESSLREIDSLLDFYKKIKENESETARANMDLGVDFPMTQQKSETKEFQLLDKKVKLNDDLRALEEQKIEENKLFDIISSFQVTGNVVSYWYEKYSLLFPIIAFMALCLAYILRKFAVYVKNYEG